jgi:hypothetical protein
MAHPAFEAGFDDEPVRINQPDHDDRTEGIGRDKGIRKSSFTVCQRARRDNQIEDDPISASKSGLGSRAPLLYPGNQGKNQIGP